MLVNGSSVKKYQIYENLTKFIAICIKMLINKLEIEKEIRKH